MQIIPIRELKNTVEIEKRCAESQEPVFITKNGYGRLVVMDIEYFEKLFQQTYEAMEVNKGLNDLKNGNVIDGKKVMDEIKKKYGF